jgi:tripartite ATP-independent transporter DctP family solute receptor
MVSATAILSLALAGCGQKAPTNQAAAASNPTAAAKPGNAKPILLRVGYILATGSDADKAAQKFKELVDKNSNGRIDVQTFPNSQLGSDQDMVNAQQSGSLEMEISGDGPVNIFEPSYGALTMPFAFRDIDHMLKVYNGPIGQQLSAAFVKDKGVRLVGVWARGPRYLTANKEIKTPDDLKGYKLRVPTQATYVETWKRLGAIPTPLNLSELYTALQQGVVGGQENPLDLILTSSFFQVQKYVMDTKHVYGPYLVTANDKFYNGLPADLKKVVDDALKEATTYEIGLVKDEETQNRAELEKKGMKFVTVDHQAFVDKMKGLPEELEKSQKWIPGQYQQIVDTK